MSGRSSTKGVYFRDGIAYIRYQDERGADVRESTKQRSSKIAEDILAKRKTEVAMRVHLPTRAFDAVTFAELADYCERHLQFRREARAVRQEPGRRRPPTS